MKKHAKQRHVHGLGYCFFTAGLDTILYHRGTIMLFDSSPITVMLFFRKKAYFPDGWGVSARLFLFFLKVRRTGDIHDRRLNRKPCARHERSPLREYAARGPHGLRGPAVTRWRGWFAPDEEEFSSAGQVILEQTLKNTVLAGLEVLGFQTLCERCWKLQLLWNGATVFSPCIRLDGMAGCFSALKQIRRNCSYKMSVFSAYGNCLINLVVMGGCGEKNLLTKFCKRCAGAWRAGLID